MRAHGWKLSLYRGGLWRHVVLPAVCWMGIWSSANAAAAVKGTFFRLSGTHPAFAIAPRLVMSRRGDALALWTEGGQGARVLWANRFHRATGWGGAAKVGVSIGDEGDARGALNRPGVALLVWTRVADGVTELVACRHHPLRGWQSPCVIEGSEGAVAPQVTLDDAGNALAIWNRYDLGANGYDLLCARLSSKGWSAPRLLAKGQPVPSASLSGREDGRAAVLWSGAEACAGTSRTRYSTRVTLFTPDTGFSPALPLGREIVDEALLEDAARSAPGHHFPLVAVGAVGDVLALWQEVRSGGRRSILMGSRFLAGKGWNEARRFGQEPIGVAAAFGEGGEPLVCFTQSESWPGISTYVSSFSVLRGGGGGWVTEKVLDEYPHFCLRPQLAPGAAGSLLVAWLTEGEEHYELWGAVRGAAGWGAPFRLDVGGRVLEYEIAGDGKGNFIAVWSDEAGAGSGVWARLLSL